MNIEWSDLGDLTMMGIALVAVIYAIIRCWYGRFPTTSTVSGDDQKHIKLLNGFDNLAQSIDSCPSQALNSEDRLTEAKQLIVQARMLATEKKYDDAYLLLEEAGGILDELRKL